MYDLLIKNATVIDGSGEASFVADLASSGGKIVDIAQHISTQARLVVQAEGLVLAPGFIDVQNHSDSYWCLFDNPSLDSNILQGFTSMLVGNCGTSLAPLLSREALKSSQKWHNLSGTNFNWTTFSEFAETLSSMRFGGNVGSMVGYSTLRRGLIGDAHRSLSEAESSVLLEAFISALKAGAFGLSTGLSYSHEASVSELELYDLAKIATEHNALFSVHLRDEAEHLAESVEEAIEIAQRCGVRLKISHFKVRGKANWYILPEVLERLELAVHQGADISLDMYPYTSTWQPLYTYLPKWATQAGRDGMIRMLGDEVQYKKILSYLHEHSDLLRDLVVASTSYQMRVIGKSFGLIAERLGVSVEEALLEVLKNGGAEILVFDACLDEQQVRDLLLHPLSVVATDGGGFNPAGATKHADKLVHPRSFGAAPKFLAFMRQDKKLSLETAIAKLTSVPARIWGLKNRGQIAIGNVADLVLFNPLQIDSQASLVNPFHTPVGIQKVWVNGELAVDGGAVTGNRSGVFLRRL